MVANEASLVVPSVVNDAVVKIAAEEGFKKPRFHFESGSNDGDGYTSVIYRAIIQDEEGKKDELRLICKTTACDVTPEGHMMQFMFDAEAEMYDKFLPALESIAKLQAPLPWPKAYHVWTGTPRPCLVVADKGPEAFRMADRRVPLDEKHLRLALTQLATFHGAAMALEKLRPDEFDPIAARRTEPYRAEEMRNMWRSFMAGMVETPEMMVDRFPEGSEINLKLKRFCSTYIDEFFERRMTPGKGVGNSMIHGDCHTNNMLFQYDKAGAVTGCCLIDFQTTRYSSTTQDLSTLLLACTDRASRKHLDALLKHYHTVLQDTLRAAGIKDPDSVYSWDQFMSRFTSVAGYGLFVAPLLIHAFHAELDKVKELQGSVANLLNESDVQPAQAAFTVNWTATVKQRVGDLVEDMVARGWL